MNIKVPKRISFVDFPGSMSYEPKLFTDMETNESRAGIVLEGNEDFYLTLSNMLLYLFNQFEDNIELHNIPFIDSNIQLTIKIVEKEVPLEGNLIQIETNTFEWEIMEDTTAVIAEYVHAMAFGAFAIELRPNNIGTKNCTTIYMKHS